MWPPDTGEAFPAHSRLWLRELPDPREKLPIGSRHPGASAQMMLKDGGRKSS